ncbi:hypothetical protein TNCV_2749051 [Trichonephila clavipes]|nr:hypothetical protein TNCV_2749051 [Trichonephila clavipes]
MKCMHLGEKTEDMPTQRDKPSNLGEKTEDTGELNDTSPPILVRKQRTPVNSTRQALQSWCVKTTTALDDDEASVSLGQVTKFAPDAESQVFQRHGSEQAAFQTEPFIDLPDGSAVSGGREEVGMIHRDANHFWIFAILRNTGNRQFDRDRLATMVKHIGMGEKG